MSASPTGAALAAIAPSELPSHVRVALALLVLAHTQGHVLTGHGLIKQKEEDDLRLFAQQANQQRTLQHVFHDLVGAQTKIPSFAYKAVVSSTLGRRCCQLCV